MFARVSRRIGTLPQESYSRSLLNKKNAGNGVEEAKTDGDVGSGGRRNWRESGRSTAMLYGSTRVDLVGRWMTDAPGSNDSGATVCLGNVLVAVEHWKRR